MIIGIGVDVLEVERMQRTIDRYGDQFLGHVFTDEERREAPTGAGKAAYYAGRWAAKEAIAKALGTGIGRRCGWTDIRVLRGPDGQPQVTLHGVGAATASTLKVSRIHISISHERKLACASAVAEKDPT
ncbi:MAG: holo-[acyl-carrier-protein] synthase [Lentisphaerae bacterium RIFOXYB12_FULL_65_16]|nr:MAG: holo-[acyl-carrier-protein] synthase [Lentisphaerae bacterium RIFOXYA12_64_32]OGV92507.1 MAG: holo-[acyl-carrier-protein] synthase [Lentisphaerae bacterium RIFOXYB12_FULL_65_16]